MDEKMQVVAVRHDDKFAALEQALAQTAFFEGVEKQWVESGKTREEFLIVIKPNIMMANQMEDPSTITDPQLVERLIDTLATNGFSNIAVVESQNVYGNWFHNREVGTVARHFGYTGKNYRIVDLTQEMVPFDYGGRLGTHPVGPTWRDADFRISFAKNKTHISCYFTLTLKNLYGCMPMQDKFKEYHEKREFDWPTVEMMKHFPCHFGLIDAIWSADGMLGLKSDYTPRHTNTIIAGENIIAVEWVGARKMGLDPYRSRIFVLATTAFGAPEVAWEGDKSVYQDWVNVPPLLDELLDLGEEQYVYANWIGFISSEMDPAFPPKVRFWLILLVRKIFTWILKQLARIESLRLFRIQAPTAAHFRADEVTITHRYNNLLRPLKKRGIINVFELLTAVPAYQVAGLFKNLSSPSAEEIPPES